MSVKFEVNFESLFERLVDNIKAMTFIINTKKYVLPFSRLDNYRDRF